MLQKVDLLQMKIGTDGLFSEKSLKIHQKTSYSFKSNELITTDKLVAQEEGLRRLRGFARINCFVTIVTTFL